MRHFAVAHLLVVDSQAHWRCRPVLPLLAVRAAQRSSVQDLAMLEMVAVWPCVLAIAQQLVPMPVVYRW